MNLNNITLSGRLGKAPVLRYTDEAKTNTVTDAFILYNDGFGERQSKHTITVTLWGKSAEAFCQHAKVGNEYGFQGRLLQQSWTANDGSERSKHVINAFMFEFGQPSKKNEETQAAQKEKVPF